MPLHWIMDGLQKLEQDQLRRYPRVCEPLPQGCCRLDGRECVHFGSNDYLGLALDPRVIAAAAEATRRFGTGAQASALVSGRTPLHAELEAELAELEGTESALLFPSGFAANLGVITSLVGTGDVVLCDRLNHASLIDGCRLSGARLRVYAHNDLTQLRIELAKIPGARRRLIVTDSLFSMDGDCARLPELAQLARESETMLLVDEAHATGVYGTHGSGLCEPIADFEGLIRIGTLSKAIGSQGGFLAGSQPLVDWVRNTARSQMFSTALTPGACGAARESIRIITHEPQRRERVRSLARQLRQRLLAAGWSTPGEPDSPIIPILTGTPERAIQLSSQLLEHDFFVPAIRPPTVPQGTSRLRISLSAAHTEEQLDGLVSMLSREDNR